MGMVQSQGKITKFSKLEAITVCSQIIEFDKIFLLINDLIDQGEALRSKVVCYRELLLRITKVHQLKDPNLLNAFRVWLYCVGACNDGDINKVQFKADWEDYDNPKPITDDIIDKVQHEAKAGFGKLLQMGEQAVAKLTDKKQEEVKQKLATANMGKCADYRIEYWTLILQEYIDAIKKAEKQFPLIVDRLNIFIEKIKAMKEHKDKLIDMVKHMENMEKAKSIGIVTANITQYGFAYLVAQDFQKRLVDHVKELKEFLKVWKKTIQDEIPNIESACRKYGSTPYYKDPNKVVLRAKIGLIAKNMLAIPNRSSEEDAEDLKQKNERKSKKPRKEAFAKEDDVQGEENVFPSKYRWLSHNYYDTQFSAQSIALSELENARKIADPARKKLFKLTGVGSWNQKTVASAFEVWTWLVSADLGGLGQLELKLIENSPFLQGKEIEKVKFSPQAEEFRVAFVEWLNFFTPPKYKRLAAYFDDFLDRKEVIYQSRFKAHLLFLKDLQPQDQYNALTSLGKNILANEVYADRAKPLYNAIIKLSGEQSLELFKRSQEIIKAADEVGPQVKGEVMTNMAAKVQPGRLAQEAFRQQRKEENKKQKEEINKKKALW